MMLDDFLALIPEEDKQRIDKQIDKMLEQENKKQSSIEWLLKKIWLEYRLIPNDDIIEQAKAMHKEEVEQFTSQYCINYLGKNKKLVNEYYNEKFGGQDNE